MATLIIDGKLHEGDTVRIDVGPDDNLVATRDEEASRRSQEEARAAVEREASGTDEGPVEPDTIE